MESTSDVRKPFLEEARSLLTEDFLPKIRRCLEVLEEDDLWWRAHENNNSVGNLILHLCGNVRQWIIASLGREPDLRQRSKEFSERTHISKVDLLAKLEKTLQEADRVLASFDLDELLAARTIQGFQTTALQAVFHVVEHFSFHTGQIVYITKLRRAMDLRFYNL
jgi:uncharacterized damage-inducible protein DinB